MEWTKDDLAQFAQKGLSVAQVEDQLAVLKGALPVATLRRPCTLGDGVLQLDRAQDDAWLGRWEAAAKEGRISHFIPASGAATRMFQSAVLAQQTGCTTLLALLKRIDEGEEALLPAAVGLSRIREMALWDVLYGAAPELAFSVEVDRIDDVLEVMLDTLSLATKPKGLIPFHRSETGLRTPVAEHLEEARALSVGPSAAPEPLGGVKDVLNPAEGSPIRVHFTVAQGQTEAFAQEVARHLQTWSEDDASRLEVTYSTQLSMTDCVAVKGPQERFRAASGEVLFRPGGHGALLHNLAGLDGDIVMMKNIDSVVPDRFRPAVVHWRKRLVGVALEIEAKAQEFLRRWEDDRAFQEAMTWAGEQFGQCLDYPEDLPAFLNRPIRVCGMVANEGQPGGGPFWLRDEVGESVQIVEGAQLNRDDAGQVQIWSQSTHFNPVDMVCILKDRAGGAIDLHQYVDERAWIVTHKQQGSESLKVLENPGLWNGAMAKWNTVFVEIPARTFNPVKTWADLLNERHQD